MSSSIKNEKTNQALEAFAEAKASHAEPSWYQGKKYLIVEADKSLSYRTLGLFEKRNKAALTNVAAFVLSYAQTTHSKTAEKVYKILNKELFKSEHYQHNLASGIDKIANKFKEHICSSPEAILLIDFTEEEQSLLFHFMVKANLAASRSSPNEMSKLLSDWIGASVDNLSNAYEANCVFGKMDPHTFWEGKIREFARIYPHKITTHAFKKTALKKPVSPTEKYRHDVAQKLAELQALNVLLKFKSHIKKWEGQNHPLPKNPLYKDLDPEERTVIEKNYLETEFWNAFNKLLSPSEKALMKKAKKEARAHGSPEPLIRVRSIAQQTTFEKIAPEEKVLFFNEPTRDSPAQQNRDIRQAEAEMQKDQSNS